MAQTLGYHVVKSAYGLWLPGDERGHWSEAWDEQLGLIEPRMLHQGDPIRQRMARERMTMPPVRLTDQMIAAVTDMLGAMVLRAKGEFSIAAMTIEPTHMHLLLDYTPRDIDRTIAWIGDQTTKAVHQATSHDGPVWCKGRWRGYIYDRATWNRTVSYIRRHNVRRGLPLDPYPFIRSIDM